MLTLEQKGRAIAEGARDRTLAKLATTIAERVPEARVTIAEDSLAITGKGVTSDPRLVWIGSLMR